MAENCDLFCRTCLSFIESNKTVSVNQCANKISSHHIQIREIIEQCISEMDLDISNDAVICNLCYDALIRTYTFKLKCIRTEERIYSYMDKNDLRLGDKIELSKVVKGGNFEVEDAIIISDSESVQEVINLSESEYENQDVLRASNNRLDNFNNTADMTEREQQLDKERSSAPTLRKKEHYTCAKCLYTTYRKDLLARHVSKHMTIHGENSRRRRYCCGLCNKPSMAKGNMRMHILYKHSGSMAPYQCRIGSCKDTFERKFDFNKHIVTHVSYKPFVCQLCSKGFFNERQWDAHLENMHGLPL